MKIERGLKPIDYTPINMSSQVSTEIEISVGQLPSESLTKITLDIGSGADNLENIRSRLQTRLRH